MMQEPIFECTVPEAMPKIERLDENNVILYVDAKSWLSSDYRDGVISVMERWKKEPENTRYKVMVIPTRSATKTIERVYEPKPSTFSVFLAISCLVGVLLGFVVAGMFS